MLYFNYNSSFINFSISQSSIDLIVSEVFHPQPLSAIVNTYVHFQTICDTIYLLKNWIAFYVLLQYFRLRYVTATINKEWALVIFLVNGGP